MMMFQCKTCSAIKSRKGFHRDRKTKHGIKIYKCRDCYRVAGKTDREFNALTSPQSKLLKKWLTKPMTSKLYSTHKWGYDCTVPYSKPLRV
jgi:hypothetical protein